MGIPALMLAITRKIALSLKMISDNSPAKVHLILAVKVLWALFMVSPLLIVLCFQSVGGYKDMDLVLTWYLIVVGLPLSGLAILCSAAMGYWGWGIIELIPSDFAIVLLWAIFVMFGYLQWFVLVPFGLRWWRNRQTSKNHLKAGS